MRNIYLVKDLARISGLSTHTVKFYLRIGILKEFGRSPETNFRYFDDSSLKTIQRIKTLQEKDKSLKEIQALFEKKRGRMNLYNQTLAAFVVTLVVLFGPAAFAQTSESGDLAASAPAVTDDAESIQQKTLELSFVDGGDLLEVLNQVKTPSGKVTIEGKSVVLNDTAAKITEMERLVKELDVQRFTMVFTLNYAKASELSTRVQGMLTKSGKVKFDEQSNKLIVTDTSAKIEEVRRLVDEIDQRDRQVLIDARIVQITLNDEHRMGVDWEAIVSNYHDLAIGSTIENLQPGEKYGRLSLGTLSKDDYTVLLEALDTVGTVEVLSNPSIVTVNNKETRILIGAAAENVNVIDTGVKLFVTPTVHVDGSITMKVRPEAGALPGDAAADNSNATLAEVSETETSVNVRDGVTMIIGGLIKEEKTKTIKKVPILGDVPFLGVAFRSHSRTVKKTETVIFLTPKISTADAIAAVSAVKK